MTSPKATGLSTGSPEADWHSTGEPGAIQVVWGGDGAQSPSLDPIVVTRPTSASK